MEKKEFNIKRFIPLIYIITVLIIMLISFKVAIFLMPFVIALLVVSITRPFAKILHKYLKIKINIANYLSISLFYLIILSGLITLIFLLISELKSLVLSITSISINIRNTFLILNDNFLSFKNYFPEFVQNKIIEYISIFARYISNIGINIINQIVKLGRNIPTIMVYIIITVMSTFLISKDLDSVYEFFHKQFPKVWIEKFKLIKVDAFEAAFRYFKAQLILISLTFFELLIGFSIINSLTGKLEYVLVYAFFIALIDAMPIIGTGPILIPWSMYSFIIKDYSLGIGLISLYITIFLVRQILEPRILSKTLNINPLISLVSMFIGFKIFGVVGFLFGPVLFLVMRIVFENEIKQGFFKILAGEKINEKDN